MAAGTFLAKPVNAHGKDGAAKDILDRFIAQAKENVASGYYITEGKTKPSVKKVSLRQTLEKRKFSLISEIKHASPAGEYSFGHIDVAKTAMTFRECGADAISVVVEPKIFLGNLGHIAVAKQSGLPVLFKDFVIDDSQINAAAFYGADCMLLVATVAARLNLDLDSMVNRAHALGLEVLLECYDAAELKTALGTRADIIGVNNRDLKTLKVDLNHTKRFIASVPKGMKLDRPLISESGVRNRQDAEFLRSVGAKGILVGTALWKADDLAAKVRELRLEEN